MSKKTKNKLEDKYISEKYKELLILQLAIKKLSKQEKRQTVLIKSIKGAFLFLLALVCPYFYREIENLQKLKQIEIKEFCIELNMGQLGYVKDSEGNYHFKYTHYKKIKALNFQQIQKDIVNKCK